MSRSSKLALLGFLVLTVSNSTFAGEDIRQCRVSFRTGDFSDELGISEVPFNIVREKSVMVPIGLKQRLRFFYSPGSLLDVTIVDESKPSHDPHHPRGSFIGGMNMRLTGKVPSLNLDLNDRKGRGIRVNCFSPHFRN